MNSDAVDMTDAPSDPPDNPFDRKPAELIPERRRPRTRGELKTDTPLVNAYEAGRLCSRLAARAGLRNLFDQWDLREHWDWVEEELWQRELPAGRGGELMKVPEMLLSDWPWLRRCCERVLDETERLPEVTAATFDAATELFWRDLLVAVGPAETLEFRLRFAFSNLAGATADGP